MRIHTRSIVIAAAIAGFAGSALAQAPAPGGPPANVAEVPAAPAVALPAPPADFTYSSEGRRDPFVSLLNRGTDLQGAQVKRVQGIGGLQTNELAVRGIVQSRGAWAAIVKGPDGKVYTLRAGDHLLDGTVHVVTAQFVAVLQEVNDPLSSEKQREVRKYLRGGEEVK
jgi:Tfp pilus assembly protein PilP